MRALISIVLVLFAVFVVWVALANHTQQVTLTLGFGVQREANMAEVIIVAVLAGAGFMGLVGLVDGLALRVDNHRLKRRVRHLEDETANLRNLALRAPGADRGSLAHPDSGPVSLSDKV